MMYLSDLFDIILNLLNSFYFLLIVESIFLVLKLYLLIFVSAYGFKSHKITTPWLFLLLVLIGGIFSDAAWIASILHELRLFYVNYKPVLCVIRIAWIWGIIEYQALGLFIESLLQKKYNLGFRQKSFAAFSLILMIIHLYTAVFKYHEVDPRPAFEYVLLKISSIYVFIPLLISLGFALRKLQSANEIPKIIRKQCSVLLKWFIIPHLISDFIQNYPFEIFPSLMANNYAVVSISTIFLTVAFYFAARKMMGLRFLNFHAHILSSTSLNTIQRFKDVLEQLSQVTSVKELSYITQTFFRTSLNLNPNRVTLYIRQKDSAQLFTNSLPDNFYAKTQIEEQVEYYVNAEGKIYDEIRKNWHEQKVLITDETAFNDFYNETEITREHLRFLESIAADIFVPSTRAAIWSAILS